MSEQSDKRTQGDQADERLEQKKNTGELLQCEDVDTSTGATPGVANACKEFGMDDSASFAVSRGIKPPGQA